MNELTKPIMQQKQAYYCLDCSKDLDLENIDRGTVVQPVDLELSLLCRECHEPALAIWYYEEEA